MYHTHACSEDITYDKTAKNREGLDIAFAPSCKAKAGEQGNSAHDPVFDRAEIFSTLAAGERIGADGEERETNTGNNGSGDNRQTRANLPHGIELDECTDTRNYHRILHEACGKSTVSAHNSCKNVIPHPSTPAKFPHSRQEGNFQKARAWRSIRDNQPVLLLIPLQKSRSTFEKIKKRRPDEFVQRRPLSHSDAPLCQGMHVR